MYGDPDFIGWYFGIMCVIARSACVTMVVERVQGQERAQGQGPPEVTLIAIEEHKTDG